MANKLFQELNKSSGIPNNIRQMVNNLKMISNPQAYAMQMLKQNPQLASIVSAANGNYEQAFRNLARQMNVNPEEIISMLK